MQVYGGPDNLSHFPIFVNNKDTGLVLTAPIAIENQFNVSAGNYTVGETRDPNYITTFSGDCDAKGNLTIPVYTSKVCTITNKYITPTYLFINNVVVGGAGNISNLQQFVYSKDRGIIFPVIPGLPVPVSQGGFPLILNPGNYTINQTPLPNYTPIYSGDCKTNGDVILTAGISSYCTITNIFNPIPFLPGVLNNQQPIK
jgi:hypothetical protein